MGERIDTVVVGAGHAGLAMSRLLRDAGRAHVVLERGQIAERWRSERWDSFTLLSPRWHTRLPGFVYDGDEPDGFMTRAEVVELLEAYARSFDAPVRRGAAVEAVEAADEPDHFLVRAGTDIVARNVVVAIGHYHVPAIPAVARELPADIVQVHSSAYRNPDSLPVGAVLVVGAGASGQQIAEDLHRAGRRVFLSVGRHNKLPRRYRGKDTVWWMDQMGAFDQTAASLPSLEEAMRKPSVSLTGVGGGHDLDLHRFAADGIVLLGHLRSVDGTRLGFADDLAAMVAAGDQVFAGFTRSVDAYIEKLGLEVPPDDAVRTAPREHPTIPSIDLREEGITSIVWATGFRNQLHWIRFPILSEQGEPIHTRGVTAQPGLYFLGLRWLHKRKSNFIDGVAEDAAHLVEQIGYRASRMR